MPIIRGGTSRGAHVRALADLLRCLIDETYPEVLSRKRQVLRTHLALLERAYPGELRVNESELAQGLAEEDGDAVQE